MSASEAGQRTEYRRDEHGKFVSEAGPAHGGLAAPGVSGPAAGLAGLAAAGAAGAAAGAGGLAAAGAGGLGEPPQFSSLLSHVEQLEKSLAENKAKIAERDAELARATRRIEGFTQKNRAAMESALSSIIKRCVCVRACFERVSTVCISSVRADPARAAGGCRRSLLRIRKSRLIYTMA
jgi:hypothetical protein